VEYFFIVLEYKASIWELHLPLWTWTWRSLQDVRAGWV